jgi:hypothetical protein
MVIGSWIPPEILGIASLIPFAIGVTIVVAGVLVSARHGLHSGTAFSQFLGLGLDFLLAAGLVRLAATSSWAMIGITASIIVTRRIVLIGLGYGARAEG